MRAERDALATGLEETRGLGTAGDFDRKRGLEERQIFQMDLNRLAESRRGRRPRGRESQRGFPVLLEGRAGRAFRAGQRRLEISQLVPLPPDLLALPEHLLERAAVLSLQLREGVEPFGQLGQPCGIGLEPLDLARHGQRRIRDSLQKLGHLLDACGVRRVDVGERLESASRHGQCRQDAAVLGLERGGDLREKLADSLHVREHGLLDADGLFLARLRLDHVDLLDLKVEVLEAADSIASGAGNAVSILVPHFPFAVQLRGFLAQGFESGKAVHELPRRGRIEEIAGLGLPIEHEEPGRDFSQGLQRRGRAVDEEASLPARRDLAPHDDAE